MRELKCYEVFRETIGDGKELKFIDIFSAYTPEGLYIGNPDWAKRISEMGIVPTIRQKENNLLVNDGRGFGCSIGFCEKEQKWFGWSPGKILPFGIGDKVRVGDVAFVPRDEEEYIRHLKEMFRINPILSAEVRKENGKIKVSYKVDKGKGFRPDEREKIFDIPDTWGRGEWTAKTLEDAKEMASQFADGLENVWEF